MKFLLIMVSLNGSVGTYPFDSKKDCEKSKVNIIHEVGRNNMQKIECVRVKNG